MRLIKVISVLLTIAPLVACQSNWYESPGFGNSVNDAVSAQAVNPNAPIGNKTPTRGLDGPAAKAGIDQYQRSYENKTTTGNYPGSGASSTSTSGGSGLSTMGTPSK